MFFIKLAKTCTFCKFGENIFEIFITIIVVAQAMTTKILSHQSSADSTRLINYSQVF